MRATRAAAEMRRTWLVQRLTRPIQSPGPMAGFAEVFSFGGGYRNGGLSPEAMNALRPIFRFDYMGAAEFEVGAVPKALAGLAESRELVAESITIPLREVEAHWRERKQPAPEGEATVYLLCRKSQLTEVEKRVRAMAAKDYQLKEATHLPSTLRPVSQYDGDTVGWLELDNGFMFFTDREMWAQTSALFGVTA